MLEDEDGMSERGLSSSRRRYDDEEGERNLGGRPTGQRALPSGGLVRPRPIRDMGKAPGGVLSLVGRWQISPWLIFWQVRKPQIRSLKAFLFLFWFFPL